MNVEKQSYSDINISLNLIIRYDWNVLTIKSGFSFFSQWHNKKATNRVIPFILNRKILNKFT